MKSWLLLTILVLSYVAYLLLGAHVVSSIEGPYEAQKREELRQYKAKFLQDSFCVNESELEAFLEKVLSANKYGVSVLRNATIDSNWDFASAFFFASTLVTTVDNLLPPTNPMRQPKDALLAGQEIAISSPATPLAQLEDVFHSTPEIGPPSF